MCIGEFRSVGQGYTYYGCLVGLVLLRQDDRDVLSESLDIIICYRYLGGGGFLVGFKGCFR